jgi:hypothetical protein
MQHGHWIGTKNKNNGAASVYYIKHSYNLQQFHKAQLKRNLCTNGSGFIYDGN